MTVLVDDPNWKLVEAGSEVFLEFDFAESHLNASSSLADTEGHGQAEKASQRLANRD